MSISSPSGLDPASKMTARQVAAPGRGLPRAVDFVIALGGLLLAGPVLALSAGAILISSRGPVLFRQQRVGKGGRLFTMLKLRTMKADGSGALITARGDHRVTGVGCVLRRTKLDELPELWNVVRGEMSLVGPRPEVPAFVDLSSPLWQEVLTVRPGITDPVTLVLRNEEELNAASEDDPEQFYRQRLQPYKLLGYVRYLRKRTPRSDLMVLIDTVLAVAAPGRTPPPSLHDIEAALARADGEVGGSTSTE